MVCTRYDPPQLSTPFKELAWRARVFESNCLDELGIAARTFRRWVAEDSAPLMARKLCVLRCGDLGAVFHGWDGWRFYFDADTGSPELWSPEDQRYTPGDIRAIPWLVALADEMKKDAPPKVRALPVIDRLKLPRG